MGRPVDLAFDATVRAAAPFQRQRQVERARRNHALVVARHNLQRKVRVRRAANLVLFVVDTSWSMASSQRIETAKGAVLSLLHDTYRRRDRVGMITFRGQDAEVVLPPTSSVELAPFVLQDIPVMPVEEEAYHLAGLPHQSGVRAIVIDFEYPVAQPGLAQKLAAALGGPCYTLPELEADALVRAVLQTTQYPTEKSACKSGRAMLRGLDCRDA